VAVFRRLCEQVAQAMHVTRHDVRTALQEDASEAMRDNAEVKAAIANVRELLDDVRRTLDKLDEFARARA